MSGLGSRVFLKPGKGKTSSVLKAFKALKAQGMVDAMLVIAPLRVIVTSWPQEIENWADFSDLSYSIIHGGAMGRRNAMLLTRDIYLMNVEGLLLGEWAPVKKWPDRKKSPVVPNPFALKWLQNKRVMLVVDESTKFKNSNAARFKSLKTYLPYFHRRVILTGTPQPKKLEDLFGQCYITDQGEDLGKFITHFRNHYMYPSPSGFGYEPQPGAAERVAAKIAPTTVEEKAEEALPSEEVNIVVPLPDSVRKQYNELKREFLVSIEDSMVMAPNSGVLYNKLRQLAQGAIFVSDKKDTWQEVHPHKIMALQNLLEELNGDPLFCLYQYSHDYERLEQAISKGEPLPRVGGGISAAKGAAYCRQFATGSLPLLLGHPLSAAHGIDGLQRACSNVCWLGLDASWENYYQANLRVVRSGNKAESVSIYRIITDCAIEWATLDMMQTKRDSEENLLELIRDYIKQE